MTQNRNKIKNRNFAKMWHTKLNSRHKCTHDGEIEQNWMQANS